MKTLLLRVLLGLAIATTLATTRVLAQTPGVTATTVTLGQSAAFSGPAQALGNEMRLGAKIFFDALNAAGGVNGRTIELLSLDDGYEPARAEANTKKLLDEQGVFALFGYVGTPTSLAALPLFTNARAPFFAPFTGAEQLRTPANRYIFNIRASYFDETEEIVRFILDSPQRNVAVFYQNDAYGKAGLAGVERALAKRKMQLVSSGTVERNTVVVTNAVKDIAAGKPDAVVMISAYASVAEFVRAARKSGFSGSFYNVSFVGSRALSETLKDDGHGVIISQVVPFPWDQKIPVVKEYQRAMERAGQKDFSFTSLEGFIAAKVFTTALRTLGRDVTRERLIDALERSRDLDVGGFIVGFGPNQRAGSQFVELTIIGRGGKFIR